MKTSCALKPVAIGTAQSTRSTRIYSGRTLATSARDKEELVGFYDHQWVRLGGIGTGVVAGIRGLESACGRMDRQNNTRMWIHAQVNMTNLRSSRH